MNANAKLYVMIGVVVLCVVVLCLSTSIGEDRKTYEMETQVYSVPAHQSDASRAIDAYERLMERYTALAERSFVGPGDVEALVNKLDAIDGRLASLDARLARIERHLGLPSVHAAPPAEIEPNSPSVSCTTPVPLSPLTRP